MYNTLTPCRIRTYRRQLRRSLLYPPELRVLFFVFIMVFFIMRSIIMLGIIFIKERHIPCIPYKQGTRASISKKRIHY